jgi:hypothetical protein
MLALGLLVFQGMRPVRADFQGTAVGHVQGSGTEQPN